MTDHTPPAAPDTFITPVKNVITWQELVIIAKFMSGNNILNWCYKCVILLESFCIVCAQPMRDGGTVWRYLSRWGCIHRMILHPVWFICSVLSVQAVRVALEWHVVSAMLPKIKRKWNQRNQWKMSGQKESWEWMWEEYYVVNSQVPGICGSNSKCGILKGFWGIFPVNVNKW